MKKRSHYVCFCMRALPSVAGGRVVEVGACGRGHSWVRILFLPGALPSVAGGRVVEAGACGRGHTWFESSFCQSEDTGCAILNSSFISPFPPRH